MGIAGAYIFLLYLSLPVLLEVRSGRGSPARSALDGERERDFLMNITGCTEQDAWSGGIRNRRVQRQASLLGRRHAGFSGMKRQYLDFVAAAVTLAPLEVRVGLRMSVDTRICSSYWRYMRNATSLLDADIGDEPSARDRCRGFVDAYGAPSAEGSRLYASLESHHPWYVDLAVPLLPAHARAIVSTLKKDARC